MMVVTPQQVSFVWRQLLRCQTHLTLPLELSFYYGCRDWLEAKSVVDLGTGLGYYLMRLCNLFPDKEYVGIDQDSEYIDCAKRESSERLGQIRFVRSNLFAVEGAFPFVITRLVAQHLRSLEAFLRHIYRLLAPGGVFLSIEPMDPLRSFYPALNGLSSLFARFAQERAAEGFHRDAGVRMEKLAPSCGLSLQGVTDLVIPSTLPTYRDLFVEFYQLILDLFADEYRMKFDKALLQRELELWLGDPSSYAQIGIHVAWYKRDRAWIPA